MIRRQGAVVVLNPAARGGTGASRFQQVRRHLERYLDLQVLIMGAKNDWMKRLGETLKAGERFVISAGGDGTASSVIHAVKSSGVSLGCITLGAVALGSSNDLHKPVAKRLQGVSVRLDVQNRTPRDVGRVLYWDECGRRKERTFLVSASVGVAAEANAFFNQGTKRMCFLKHVCVDLAVIYAAMSTLWRYKAPNLVVRTGDEILSTQVANLSITKTQHLAGALKFDTVVQPASGTFSVNFWPKGSRLSLLFVLTNLLFGRFSQIKGASHWDAAKIEIRAQHPLPVEIDGEVVTATRAIFDILPEKVWLCG